MIEYNYNYNIQYYIYTYIIIYIRPIFIGQCKGISASSQPLASTPLSNSWSLFLFASAPGVNRGGLAVMEEAGALPQ